ncbi:hypothetical protein ABW19_dt0208898 [Dactylella cylindrospora]|nr:hypothetical protein ABW19_dt0208898 [Dactylella cylindrospora]
MCSIEGEKLSPERVTWGWHDMGFFTNWKQDGSRSILCLDCPPAFVDDVRGSLDGTNPIYGAPDGCPYAYHLGIVRGVVNLFNASLSGVEGVMRELQRNRELKGSTPGLDYLYTLSTHLAEYRDSLTVAMETVSKIMNQQRRKNGLKAPNPPVPSGSGDNAVILLSEDQTFHETHAVWVHKNLALHHEQLFGLKRRTEFLQTWNQNEIALAQSRTIAANAVADAAAMNVIAGLTVTFLPATFISVAFLISMSLFGNRSNRSEVDSAGWNASPELWINWAIAIVLAAFIALTLILGDRVKRYFGIVWTLLVGRRVVGFWG